MTTTESPAPRLVLSSDDTVPVLRLPETLDYEGLKSCLREELPAHVSTIGNRSIRLDLGGREIALFDLRRVLNLLRQEFSLEATGLYVRPAAILRFAERELKLKLFPTPADPPAAKPSPSAAIEDQTTEEPVPAVLPPPATAPAVTLPNDLGPDVVPSLAAAAPAAPNTPTTPAPPPPREEGRRTHAVNRTLRSGNSVRFDGDVYVYGDVNPGAQIVATGNIVVLGALKGVAHAGAAGDEDCFIIAFDLRPTQIRIGRRIAVSPPARPQDAVAKAFVVGEQIVIQPYATRVR